MSWINNIWQKTTKVLFKNDKATIVANSPQQGHYIPFYREDTTNFDDENQLNNSSYPIYTHMFNSSNMGKIRHYDAVSFDSVIMRLKMMSEPLLNDFYEESESREWLIIQPHFFEFAFYNDFIYIEWDEENKKYNIYLKTTPNEDDLTEDLKATTKGYTEKNWWINILTNEKVYFAKPEEALIRFSWMGRPVDMFKRWFKFAYQYEIKLDVFDSSCLLFHKRLILEKNAGHNAQAVNINLLDKDLGSKASYLNRVEGQSMVGFIPMPIMPGMELDLYFTAVCKWVDRQLTELGRLVNLNPKLERKTAGENDLAIDRQVDYLRAVLNQLKLMSLEMEEKGWPPLIFKVNTSRSIELTPEPEAAPAAKPPQTPSPAPAPAPK